MKPDLAPTMYETLSTPATWYGWKLCEQLEFLTRVHDCLNGIRNGAYNPSEAKPAIEKLLGIRKEVDKSYMHPDLIRAFSRESVWATMDTDNSPWIRREYWVSWSDEPHISPGTDDINGVALLLDDKEEDYEERHPFIAWWEKLRVPFERIAGRVRPYQHKTSASLRRASRFQ